MKPNQFLYVSMHICVNTHIYKCNCELEPGIWMHKGNVEVKFHTYAIFVWYINEWWPPLCNLACWKCLQCWSHYGLFDLLSTWGQKKNVSSCPRWKEKKQLSSALSFIAFGKIPSHTMCDWGLWWQRLWKLPYNGMWHYVAC